MVYCVSDLHGEQDRLTAMLEKIHFSPEDTLYILGDVIDRMPGGVDILRKIRSSPNMILLLGNHEQMCLETLGPRNTLGSRALWQQNGGSCTYRELTLLCTPGERRELLAFLADRPDHLEVEAGGTRFHLVHGYPGSSTDARIWGRPHPEAPPPFPDRTAVIGHTPTCFLTEQFQDPCRIWHGNGVIDIDCGCGNKNLCRRLACLRLDDLAEFYV